MNAELWDTPDLRSWRKSGKPFLCSEEPVIAMGFYYWASPLEPTPKGPFQSAALARKDKES